MKSIQFSLYPNDGDQWLTIRKSLERNTIQEDVGNIEYRPPDFKAKHSEFSLGLDFALLITNEIMVTAAAHFATSYVLKLLKAHKEKFKVIKIGSQTVRPVESEVAKAFLDEIEKLERSHLRDSQPFGDV